MISPEVQNDILIDKLMAKSDLFIPNVVLYFERDTFLMRNQDYEIFHSAKSYPNGGGGYSPHFDPFDVSPMRTVKAQQVETEFKFSIRDFQLNLAKGWFIWVESRELDKGKLDDTGFWIMYMNGQFYFYYPVDKKVVYSKGSGQLQLKGKTLFFDLLDEPTMKLNLYVNPQFPEFPHFISSCFQNKTSQPLDSFVKSFKATKGHPDVNEETISFYRFYFQNPTFLLVLATDQNKTDTIKSLIPVFIKAANDHLFSIFRVYFFTLFRQKRWQPIYQTNLFLFDVIQALASKDQAFLDAKQALKSAENPDYKKLQRVDIGPTATYFVSLLYQVAHYMDYQIDGDLTQVVVLFYLKVLMGINVPFSEKYATPENIKFAASFSEPSNYSMVLEGPLTHDEARLFIDELTKNIDHYMEIFFKSTAPTMIENFNTYLQPSKNAKRTPKSSSSTNLTASAQKSNTTNKKNTQPKSTELPPRPPLPNKIASQKSLPNITNPLPKPIPPRHSTPPLERKKDTQRIPQESPKLAPLPTDEKELDPHLYDSFPANIPPPKARPPASSFLLQEEVSTSSSDVASSPIGSAPIATQDGSLLIPNYPPSDTNLLTGTEVKEKDEKKENEEKKEEKKENDGKEEKKESGEKKEKKEEKKVDKEDSKNKKDDKDKVDDKKEKKKKENGEEDSDSDYSSLSSSLSDDEVIDDDDLSSLSSTDDDEGSTKILKAAPRYDGTEEPPLEERDESDTTIQDDAVM